MRFAGVMATLVALAGTGMGCNKNREFDGAFEGTYSGSYSAIGSVVDGRAPSVDRSFDGAMSVVAQRRSREEVEFRFGGCRVRMKAGSAPTDSASIDPGYRSEPCPMDVGGSVRRVSATFIGGSAMVSDDGLMLELHADAPRFQNGANLAQVTWSFTGSRHR